MDDIRVYDVWLQFLSLDLPMVAVCFFLQGCACCVALYPADTGRALGTLQLHCGNLLPLARADASRDFVTVKARQSRGCVDVASVAGLGEGTVYERSCLRNFVSLPRDAP